MKEDIKSLTKCLTLEEAIKRANYKINIYCESKDKENLNYWRGVLRGLLISQQLTERRD